VHGVFQGQQAAAREVRIERLDRRGDLLQRQRAVGRVFDRLRLDAAQHRGTAAFMAIGVRQLADQVFVAAFAMRHQRGQVALGAAGEEQAGFLAGAFRHGGLQFRHGGIVAPDVVADFGGAHRLEHARRGAGDGVAAQVDHGLEPPHRNW